MIIIIVVAVIEWLNQVTSPPEIPTPISSRISGYRKSSSHAISGKLETLTI
jgi:hypothetical protein